MSLAPTGADLRLARASLCSSPLRTNSFATPANLRPNRHSRDGAGNKRPYRLACCPKPAAAPSLRRFAVGQLTTSVQGTGIRRVRYASVRLRQKEGPQNRMSVLPDANLSCRSGCPIEKRRTTPVFAPSLDALYVECAGVGVRILFSVRWRG